MDVFEAMYTQRAMRRLKPDPIPDDMFWRTMDAAVKAPNGGNLQPWNFLVLRDPAVKRRMQEFYQDGMAHIARPSEPNAPARSVPREGTPEYDEWAKTPGGHLATHMHETPALILGTVRLEDVASTTPPEGCIFPALQNMMLAARALGLGTTLTTLHRHREKDVKAYLGIPADGVVTMGMVAMGFPMGKFGPNVRRPVEEVVYFDRWGATRPRKAGAKARDPLVSDLFEVIATQRAMRHLKPDPVPEEAIWQVLDAAIRAPNASNRQAWNFVVVQDPATKAKIQELYQDGGRNVTRGGSRPAAAPRPKGSAVGMRRSTFNMGQHLAEFPNLIIATVNLDEVSSVSPPGSSVFPAVQNLMLAARAMVLGTVLTTLHRHREADVKKLLGIPERVATMTMVPLGWPVDDFGPTTRRPPEEVTFYEHWGNPAYRRLPVAGEAERQQERRGAAS